MKFEAVLESNGKTATGFVVPDEVVDALGAGKRPKVVVSLKGHTYRSSIASMGGRFLLGVSAENRSAADVSAGDRLEVEVTVDEAPRVVEVPADVATALHKNPPAWKFYATLSYSQQRGYVEPIVAAKTTETRQRRIEKMIESLAAGKKR